MAASSSLVAMVIPSLLLLLGSSSAQLSTNFYSNSCPKLLSTVKSTAQTAVLKEHQMGASLLCLFFHDCFVNGCDGSILLDGTSGKQFAGPNRNSARGFKVVDDIRSAVEKVCPGVVSCADIMAIAARDSVVALGGPSWNVKLGRRDSKTANQAAANNGIPSPFSSLSSLISRFQAVDLSTKDMVALSGNVTVMAPFLQKFFASVPRKMRGAKKNDYCVYNSQLLTLFNSLLYIAGLAAFLMARHITRAVSHRATMVLGGCTFLIGAAINIAAIDIVMLYLGRILLGLSVGFLNQVNPVYLSEMEPPKWWDAFNKCLQFFMVAANVLSYGLAQLKWGWRLSLILPAVPAAIMALGALLISLTSRNPRQVQAVNDMESGSNDPIKSSEAASAVNEEPLKTILKRENRPYLVMSVAIPLFQQLTGINIIDLYAPILFQSIGFGNSVLIASIILGLVSLGSLLLSIFIGDRCGRKVQFMVGGIQMMICQVAVACVLSQIGVSGDEPLSRNYVILVLALMCIYAAGFRWSWGSLSWLILSEIFPMEIRPASQSISVAVNFLMTSVLAQTFLTMLNITYGTFLFYAGLIAMMTIVVALFLPETKGVPVESMHTVWEDHWYWRRFVEQAPPAS